MIEIDKIIIRMRNRANAVTKEEILDQEEGIVEVAKEDVDQEEGTEITTTMRIDKDMKAIKKVIVFLVKKMIIEDQGEATITTIITRVGQEVAITGEEVIIVITKISAENESDFLFL